MKLLYHVAQEMRLLSNIIKHNRIHEKGIRSIGKKPLHTGHKEAQNVLKLNTDELMEEARKKAEDYSIQSEAKARAQAEKIIEEAHSQKEKQYAACQQACEQMKEQAQKEKEKIISEAHSLAKALIEDAEQVKQNLIQSAEKDIIEIIEKILTRVVDEKIIKHPEWLKLIVKKMITTNHLMEEMTLYVGEEVYKSFGNTLKDELKAFEQCINLKVDTSLQQSGCMLETQVGSIYYDVKEGLEAALEDLKFLQDTQG